MQLFEARIYRDVSSEISGNLLNNFSHFIIFNYNHIKFKNEHVLDKQLCRSLCFNFMHKVQRKITCI